MITLDDVDPVIWRRMLVPQDIVLPQLHTVFQAVMGWEDCHLHEFTIGDVMFGEPHEET